MGIATYNDFIARIGTSHYLNESFKFDMDGVPVLFGGNTDGMSFNLLKALPTPLPTGVTAYIPTLFVLSTSASTSVLFFKVVDMGSLNIDTNVYTAGSAMPSVTELGNTAQPTAGAVLAVVTTVLNATPGNFTITYVDQDGNASETTAVQAMPASGPVYSAGYVLLNANDWGARSISAAAQSGGTTPSGILRFYGCIPGAGMFAAGAAVFAQNLITQGFILIRLGAADQLGVVCKRSVETAAGHHGMIHYVGDS